MNDDFIIQSKYKQMPISYVINWVIHPSPLPHDFGLDKCSGYAWLNWIERGMDSSVLLYIFI